MLVLQWSSFAQIHKPVIGLVPVLMVYVRCRPNACDVEPRQPMCFVRAAIKTNLDVPFVVVATGVVARVTPVIGMNPREQARYWVIPQGIEKLGMRQ